MDYCFCVECESNRILAQQVEGLSQAIDDSLMKEAINKLDQSIFNHDERITKGQVPQNASYYMSKPNKNRRKLKNSPKDQASILKPPKKAYREIEGQLIGLN